MHKNRGACNIHNGYEHPCFKRKMFRCNFINRHLDFQILTENGYRYNYRFATLTLIMRTLFPILICAHVSTAFPYDPSLPSSIPSLKSKLSGLNVPLFRKIAERRGLLRMEREIASEVRSSSSGEPPRLYFHDDPVPRRAFTANDSATNAWGIAFRSPRILTQDAWHRLRGAASATFLPAGYPASVPQEYLAFQLWNVLQDLTRSLRSILATQKILEGMGVGRAGVTSLVATMQWMARDGASMIGGLVFTAIAGASFGLNIKKW
jgi:hypothetical protein